MKAVVVHGPGDIRYEDVEEPTPGAGEVLVHVRAAGICGSDIVRALGSGAHYYPIILGHEVSGEVCKSGELSGGRFRQGERVAVAPLIPCFTCPSCERGHFSLCMGYDFIGSRRNGGFAEYVAVPERNLVRLQDSVSYEAGAMLEPATVPLHAMLISGFTPGESVVVLGAGTIGLLALQWARILGARKVIAVDVVPQKLEIARRLGCDVAVDARGEGAALEEAVIGETGGGAGYVFETAGHPATQVEALKVAGRRAKVVLIGTSPRDVTFSGPVFEMIIRKELAIFGSWMSYSAPFPGKEWEMALHFIASGALKVEPIITQRLPLSAAGDAIRAFASGRGNVKVMFVS